MPVEDVIIIGAGPSGIAAALQLNRYGIKPLILEKDEIGGLLLNANLVENYPGFPKGISGPGLVNLFRKQLISQDNRVLIDEAGKVRYDEAIFEIDAGLNKYQSRILVIASGTKPKKVTEPVIPADLKDIIFYEIKHLKNESGRHITIIGAGDAAFDYAINLAKKNQVTLLNRSERTRCLELLKNTALKNPKIEYRENISVKDILKGDGRLELICVSPGEKQHRETDYLVIAAGRDGNLDFLPVEFKNISDDLTAQKKLFIIGDVKNRHYRQTAICVGEGVRAAMEIFESLKGMKINEDNSQNR